MLFFVFIQDDTTLQKHLLCDWIIQSTSLYTF